MNEWITDRLPKKKDADKWGLVRVRNGDGHSMVWSYNNIPVGHPWQPIPEPKRWTVKRNNHDDEWYLYDGGKEWDRLDGRLTQDAAQRIANIYNEVMP